MGKLRAESTPIEIQPSSEEQLEAAVRNVMRVGGMTYMYARNLISPALAEMHKKIAEAKTLPEVHRIMKGE